MRRRTPTAAELWAMPDMERLAEFSRLRRNARKGSVPAMCTIVDFTGEVMARQEAARVYTDQAGERHTRH